MRPKLVLCLGATAAQAFLGSSFKLTSQRGEVVHTDTWGVPVMATYHPSALLRIPSKEQRAAMFEAFVLDLKSAHNFTLAASRKRGKRSSPAL